MGRTRIFFNLIIYGIVIKFVDSANILAILPNVWKSHYIFGRAIITELLAQGHNITLLSGYSDRSEGNLTAIEIDGIEENWIEMGLSFDYDEIRSISVVERLTKMIDVGTSNADLILGSSEMQNILNSGQDFDLFLADLFLSEALLGLGQYYKIPTVVISATGTNKWLNEMTGNPHNSALDPSSLLPYTEDMTMMQRIFNTLMSIFERLTYHFFHMLCQESVYKRHFDGIQRNGDLPPLRNLVRNVNLVVVNSHPIINYPKALVPNMIEAGGAHIQKNRAQLSQDILTFVESAPNGVVYVSFGANLRTIDLPKGKLDALIETLKSLKDSMRMRIILKWEVPRMEDQTPNIMIRSWWPQQEILAHSNVKLFISTGGLLSTMEAVRWKTPMLGVPILPEHEVNLKRIERLGCGILLPYDNFTGDNLLWGIEQMLNNRSYQDNAEKASQLFQRNINNPLEKIIYYIDLVLATDGATHLRSHATQLGFLQIELLDVFLITSMGFITILAVPSIIICLLLKKANNYKPEWIQRIEEDNKKQL